MEQTPKNKPTKFQIGDEIVVIVIGKFYAKIRNIRFDDCGEAIYDLIAENGEDYVAREFEIKKIENAEIFSNEDFSAFDEEATAIDRKFDNWLEERGF